MVAAGCGWAASEPSPSVLLVTVDTWRWDAIGAAGTHRVATPALDRLASEGVYVAEAVTPTPLTSPAHASMMTGLHPINHGILDCGSNRLRAGVATLAERLRAAGYATAAFVSGETLRARYGLDRGFEIYDDGAIDRRRADDWMPGRRRGEETTARVLAYLGHGEARPRFVWVHYFDLHTPYVSRASWDQRYPDDPYSAQVAFVDQQIGTVVGTLAGPWKVIVVGDHGEGLGDHGEQGHGYGLYRETTHVPLVLWPRPTRAIRHRSLVTLMDLMPTILDWLGVPSAEAPAEAGDGHSMFGDPQPGPVPLFAIMASVRLGVAPTLGVETARALYLRHGREELYDLERDPAERTDIHGAPRAAATLAELRRACDRLLPVEQLLARPATPPLSDPEAAQLEALGYVTGPTPDPSTLHPADLHQVLRDMGRLDDTRARAYEQGHSAELVATYRSLLDRYTGATRLRAAYARLLLDVSAYDAAGVQLELVVAAEPGDVDSRINLGAVLLLQGRVAEARAHLEEALRTAPDDAVAHKNLAILYSEHLHRWDLAVPHYQRFLDLVPDSPEAASIRANLATYRATTEQGAPR